MSWLAAATIGAGLLGYQGQRDANRTNAHIASNASQQSQTNAREQMAFQERMSNTAHQRQMADMSKAGLNPILSAKYGGASSPAGAMGQVFTYDHKSPLMAGANMGMQAASTASNISLNQATSQKIKAEATRISQTTQFEKVLHDERWPRLFATMSPENVAASGLAVVEGVDIEKVLANANHQMTAGERKNLERFLYRVQGFKGTIAREMSGVGQKIDASAKAVKEKARFFADILKEMMNGN
jgi:hypothetical protein